MFQILVRSNFCIIEGPETVQDFVQMQLQEIQDNIKSRRNKIFLLMEEVCFLICLFCFPFSFSGKDLVKEDIQWTRDHVN